MKEVDVLLATYNGAKYVSEFLESLTRQVDVSIKLIVSDDGSEDETLAIVQGFADSFQSLSILNGPGLGPSQNFLFLLKQAKSEFVAFADQDDVWLPGHLINSITRLESSEKPALSFAKVYEFSSTNQSPGRIWPKKIKVKQFANIAFENCARGCVIVMNAKAVNLLNSKEPDHVVMHDWWALQVMKSCGEVYFSTAPEIEYRIHANNFTKNGSFSYVNFFKTLYYGDWEPIRQLESLFECYENQMSERVKLEIIQILMILRNPFRALLYVGSTRVTHRNSILSEIKLRIGLVFGFILVRNIPNTLKSQLNSNHL